MADIYANKNKGIKVATKSSKNDLNDLSAVSHLGFEYTSEDAAKANGNGLEPNQRLITVSYTHLTLPTILLV